MIKLMGGAAMTGIGALGQRLAIAESLDEPSINARFNQIFDMYEIGDTLSAEDAAFIEQHALSADAIAARTTNILSGERYFNGHTYYLNGNWYHNDDTSSAMWRNYGATIQSGCADVVSQEIEVCMRFLVYGFTGSSYELIHKDEQSDSYAHVNWFTSEFTDGYMGLFAYSNVSCYARITTYSGSSFVVE